MSIYKNILNYKPFNEQEEIDKETILRAIKNNPNIFNRSSLLAHMTASAWVLNQTHDHVLMVYHNLYDSWSWMGGHADGEKNLLDVAIKEVKEESGLSHIKIISRDIFSLEVLTVDGHEKRGHYVPSHLHLNITYLLEASDQEILSIQPEENSGVQWFSLDDAIEASSEPWFQKRVYAKLNAKLK